MSQRHNKVIKKGVVWLLAAVLLVPGTITMAEAANRMSASIALTQALSKEKSVKKYRNKSSSNRTNWRRGLRYYKRGKKYLKKGDYDKAERYAKRAKRYFSKVSSSSSSSSSDSAYRSKARKELRDARSARSKVSSNSKKSHPNYKRGQRYYKKALKRYRSQKYKWAYKYAKRSERYFKKLDNKGGNDNRYQKLAYKELNRASKASKKKRSKVNSERDRKYYNKGIRYFKTAKKYYQKRKYKKAALKAKTSNNYFNRVR